MKFQPVCNQLNIAFEHAIAGIAVLRDMSLEEAEWYVRRGAHLITIEGRDPQEARRMIEAERVGEPWAKWPDDYPRF
jgi:hypothetical protein